MSLIPYFKVSDDEAGEEGGGEEEAEDSRLHFEDEKGSGYDREGACKHDDNKEGSKYNKDKQVFRSDDDWEGRSTYDEDRRQRRQGRRKLQESRRLRWGGGVGRGIEEEEGDPDAPAVLPWARGDDGEDGGDDGGEGWRDSDGAISDLGSDCGGRSGSEESEGSLAAFGLEDDRTDLAAARPPRRRSGSRLAAT